MDLNSKVYLKIKPPGMTSKDFADDIKEENKLKKICFCGRLDPMARGEMLLLGDEMCKQMDNHKNYDKTYQFEIVFGFQTDTDDFLGLIESCQKDFDSTIIYKKILDELNTYPKKFSQKFHKYSSIRVNGDPLWLHSKENKKITKLPEHIVEIKKVKVIEFYEVKFEYFLDDIIDRIENINNKHDFRQEDIVNQWINFLVVFDTIHSLKLELTVSSGFYVRQFVRDLSERLNFPLVVHDINRTKINLK